MKEYVVKMTTCGGSVKTEEFTNKRKAKAAAWEWINWQKQQHRDCSNDRDYEQLHVEIFSYEPATGRREVVAYYD